LILEFKGDLYDKILTVELLRYIRPQEKFGSLEELRQAIANDVAGMRGNG